MPGKDVTGTRTLRISSAVPHREKPATIVLVDDSRDDLFLIERAVGQCELPVDVLTFDNPREAMEFFNRTTHSSFRLPDDTVVFCDIKMPEISGFEFVAWLRDQPSLKNLRVYFLSGSNEAVDRERAKALKADGYCIKVPTPDIFRRIIENRGPVAVCDL
jgi:CheY-like chemotaxis protein